MRISLASRIFGFAASLLLTLGAYLIIVHPEILHLNAKIGVLLIFALAALQFTVQSVCFLNILSEKGPRWNLFVFFSTLFIILIIIIFSIWVMDHLNKHMMVM